MHERRWFLKSFPADLPPCSAQRIKATLPTFSIPNSGPHRMQSFWELRACKQAFLTSAAKTSRPFSAAYVKAIRMLSLETTPLFYLQTSPEDVGSSSTLQYRKNFKYSTAHKLPNQPYKTYQLPRSPPNFNLQLSDDHDEI